MSDRDYPPLRCCGGLAFHATSCTEQPPLRHDGQHEDRAALRKLRVLAAELRAAHGAADHPTVARYRGRVGALLEDVDADIVREEARLG